MPLLTPQDLITFSLKAIGVLGVGQTALAEDYTDAFSALNGMLAQWNVKRWLVWHLIDVSYSTTGAQSYTVGPGGNFNVPRPSRLEAAFFRQYVQNFPNQVDFPLEILQSREDYNNIALKTQVSFPYYIFYDAALPIGTVYPWPIPQSGVYELHLTLKEHLGQFTSYVQSLNVPDEYVEAIWTNLAIRLAAIYPGSSLPDATVGLAKASLSTVRMANTQIPRMVMPTGLTRPPLFNIFSYQTY